MLTKTNFTVRMLIMKTEKRNGAIWLVFPTKTGYNFDFEFENAYGY